MTTKHTLGPWKIDDATDMPLAVIKDDENGMGVCEIGLQHQPNKNDASPEQFANARLIAAAPELLEACRGLLDTVLAIKEEKVRMYSGDRARIKTAEAAINKAEAR